MRKSVTFYSSSDMETVGLGAYLGAGLKGGDVIALAGELGSGKTWFTKGLALGLGVSADEVITSPSFSLMNTYEGRCPLFHMDAYRLEDKGDFFLAGLEEYFYQDGVAVMEWADRWPEVLPDQCLKVEITITGQGSRKLNMMGTHPRAHEILGYLNQGLKRGTLE